MATTFPFPATPTTGQTQALTGGGVMMYNGSNWVIQNNNSPMVWRTATTSQTLSVIDEDSGLIMNSSSPTTVTLAANATTPYTVGRSTLVLNKGTGTVTIVLASGVTGDLRSNMTLVLAGQYAEVVLSKSATDTWELSGDFTIP